LVKSYLNVNFKFSNIIGAEICSIKTLNDKFILRIGDEIRIINEISGVEEATIKKKGINQMIIKIHWKKTKSVGVNLSNLIEFIFIELERVLVYWIRKSLLNFKVIEKSSQKKDSKKSILKGKKYSDFHLSKNFFFLFFT
jgi:hypothetical protein